MVERISSAYNIEGSAHTKAKENNRQPCAHADISAHTENEAFSLAGAFAPPALKGVDNPTFAHNRRKLLMWTNRVTHPTRSPHALKVFSLFFLSNRAGGAAAEGQRGGCKPHGGLGAQPPAVGAL